MYDCLSLFYLILLFCKDHIKFSKSDSKGIVMLHFFFNFYLAKKKIGFHKNIKEHNSFQAW